MPQIRYEWNPYYVLAKKVLETHPDRVQDVDRMKKHCKDLELGIHIQRKYDKAIYRLNTKAFEIGEARLTEADKLETLREHIETMQMYIDIVEYAYHVATADIHVRDIHDRVLRCLHDSFESTMYRQGKNFSLMDYPMELTEADFIARKRLAAMVVLRELGIMPYQHQPKDDRYVYTKATKVSHGVRDVVYKQASKRNLSYRADDVGL